MLSWNSFLVYYERARTASASSIPMKQNRPEIVETRSPPDPDQFPAPLQCRPWLPKSERGVLEHALPMHIYVPTPPHPIPSRDWPKSECFQKQSCSSVDCLE